MAAPHRKTYAQAVSENASSLRGAGRSGVDAAGDSAAAVAAAPHPKTEPHPKAVACLRNLNLHVLSLVNLGQNN